MSTFADEKELRKVIKNSISFRSVLLHYNMAVSNYSYRILKRYIAKFNIDISHFKKSGWSKNKSFQKIDIKNYLVENSNKITSHALKIRLINEGYFERKCSICNLENWLESLIPLELDHINGDHYDNRIENLRILCPNCHALVPNKCYREPNKCFCGKVIIKKAKFCRNCANKNIKRQREFKIEWPSINELEKMLSESNFSSVARKLGVSDSAVRKHIKNHSQAT